MSKSLNEIMEFDHVVEVHADGTVTDADGVYAPELYNGELADSSGYWSLMTGYTGQYGYNGPHMHDSEYIGGGMERDILKTPGYYVALYCTYSHAPDCDTPDLDHVPNDSCAYPEGDYMEGWVVAYHHAD